MFFVRDRFASHSFLRVSMATILEDSQVPATQPDNVVPATQPDNVTDTQQQDEEEVAEDAKDTQVVLAAGDGKEEAVVLAAGDGKEEAVVDMSTRSPLTQKFNRAVKHFEQTMALYNDLTTDLKTEFRAKWAVSKNFEFTKETRTVIERSVQSEEDKGEWMNYLQIANVLGGMEHVEARQQATAYTNKCRNFPNLLFTKNHWTEAVTR